MWSDTKVEEFSAKLLDLAELLLKVDELAKDRGQGEVQSKEGFRGAWLKWALLSILK